MDHQKLATTANALVAPTKGILAADESSPTIAKRFASIKVESTEQNRRNYREMLFRTKGINKYISGIILFDETIKQDGTNGTPLVQVLNDQDIIPGIKVDKGGKALAGSVNEKITEGLDGLRERLAEYATLGARFTKWRAIINIESNIPTKYCIDVNAHALARYATLSQEAGLVPIVEPEVLMDGDHNIQRCYDVTQMTLKEVFYQLGAQGVDIKGILLKPNMVLSGKSANNRALPPEVGKWTVDCFKSVLPPSLPGVVFLSGGQSDEEATVNLNAINQEAIKAEAPWQLSFSYGRGLQAAPLKAWAGSSTNAERAQSVFLHRAFLTSTARQGLYDQEMELKTNGL